MVVDGGGAEDSINAARPRKDPMGLPKSVLVVEDDRELRESLADLLRTEGYEVCEACDGNHALDQLQRGLRPEVIVLDLCMPGKDGWQFRTEQRSDPALASIPVVVMSGTERATMRPIDADLFVRKPFHGLMFLRSLRDLLE